MRRDAIDRRAALIGASAAGLASPALARIVDTSAQTALGPGALLGFAALDMATGHVTSVNPDLRLPMCSTFKWLLVACVFWRVGRGLDSVSTNVDYGRADILPHSPKTEARLKSWGEERVHMTVGELCEVAITVSDNAAANLLLRRVGGPAGLTAWLRAHGDGVTRLDRTEPTLNTALRNDPRDTTTPSAMLQNLRRFLFGDVLKPEWREGLGQWMLYCETGPDRLKAGVPEHWLVRHKTGTGANDAQGDVGVLVPPVGAPILVAAYTLGSKRSDAEIDRWFAGLSRLLVRDALSLRDANGRPHG